MSVESAKAYITRMREDAQFHRAVNAIEDEAANWDYVRAAGYDFSMQEFRLAKEEVYAEHGITPEW